VLDREPGAELKQRLAVSIVELVENRSPRGRRKRVEDIAQAAIIGKWQLACKWLLAYGRCRTLATPIRCIDRLHKRRA
jgi:hypothetical protein